MGYDAVLFYGEKALRGSHILEQLELEAGAYILSTVHRAENTIHAHRETLERLRAEGRFLVGYAGRVGLANALHSLIDAVARCGTNDVQATILGEGSHLPELRAQAERLGIGDRITFLESVWKAQVNDFLSRMDAVYIGLQSQPLFRFGVSPTSSTTTCSRPSRSCTRSTRPGT